MRILPLPLVRADRGSARAVLSFGRAAVTLWTRWPVLGGPDVWRTRCLTLAAQADINIAFARGPGRRPAHARLRRPHHPAPGPRRTAERFGPDLCPVADGRGPGAGARRLARSRPLSLEASAARILFRTVDLGRPDRGRGLSQRTGPGRERERGAARRGPGHLGRRHRQAARAATSPTRWTGCRRSIASRTRGGGATVAARRVSQVLDTVTFNGVTIAASDTDGRSGTGRAAGRALWSASAISEVEMQRHHAPDLDAGAIGSLIDVRTPIAHDFPGGASAASRPRSGRWIPAAGATSTPSAAPFAGHPGPRQGIQDLPGRRALGARVLLALLRHPVCRPFEHRGRPGFSLSVSWSEPRLDGGNGPPRLTGAVDWRGEGGNALWLRGLGADYNDEELRPEFMLYRRGDLSAASPEAFSWRGLRVRTETRRERQERPVRCRYGAWAGAGP